MSYLQPSLTGLAGIIFYVSHFLNTWLLTVFILCRLIYAYCIVYRLKKNIKKIWFVEQKPLLLDLFLSLSVL